MKRDSAGLKLLMVEDSPVDAELVEQELKSAGIKFTMLRVETQPAYEAALARYVPDLILCDYTLPTFDGKLALEIRNRVARDLPFLYVSGSIGEELAVEALKLGATDYVIKDRMSRLPFCVQRAIQEQRDKIDRRRMEEELRQTEKMASVGMLLGGVAHELNNPLMGILGHAQLLLADAPAAGQLREDLTVIEREAKRCKRLIKSLLTFARRQEKQFQWADLRALVEEIVELKSYDLKRASIDFKLEIRSDIGKVYLDPHQIQQVLLNLLNNAEQAIGGRKGSIRVRGVRVEDAILLEVADDGPGMTPEVQARVFEAFFTTKQAGQGTGLGLSICSEIAKEHGGTLTVESEPGSGARFALRLPAQPLKAVAPAPEVRAKGKSRTLVVDDDDMVLKFMARVLRQEGWEVETHSVASEGLASAGKGVFDLVVCDFNMPGMDGRDFFRRLNQARPDLARRFIICTGEQFAEAAREFARQVDVPVLQKPFDLEEFRRVLASLNGRGGVLAAG